ncbi:MAG: MaoC family dehydratase [Acidobacteria bacterium]|nr:MaoC family dehydratase [Acidobacteriota bacterium]
MALRVIGSVEELKTLIGQEVTVSDWIVVSQQRINAFADATSDHQWIHVNVERAHNESPFKTTIAHGFLTLSLLSQLAEQSIRVQGNFKMGINYGLNRVRFISPVAANARLHARFTLQAVEELSGGLQLTWIITVEVEGAPKAAMVAEWLVRYYA